MRNFRKKDYYKKILVQKIQKFESGPYEPGQPKFCKYTNNVIHDTNKPKICMKTKITLEKC